MVNHIMNNHDKTPSIDTSNDYMKVLGEKSKEDVMKSILVCNGLGKIHDYAGSYITKKYKKDDVLEQGIFCTDTSRDNYIMKICEGDDKGKWIKDKGGVTLKKKIVKPMIDCMREVLNDDLKNQDIDTNMLLKIANALCTIKGKEFMKKILKEIGPELQIRL